MGRILRPRHRQSGASPLNDTKRYYATLCYAMLYYTVLNFTILYYTIQYYSAPLLPMRTPRESASAQPGLRGATSNHKHTTTNNNSKTTTTTNNNNNNTTHDIVIIHRRSLRALAQPGLIHRL